MDGPRQSRHHRACKPSTPRPSRAASGRSGGIFDVPKLQSELTALEEQTHRRRLLGQPGKGAQGHRPRSTPSRATSSPWLSSTSGSRTSTCSARSPSTMTISPRGKRSRRNMMRWRRRSSDFELSVLLSGEYDKSGAFITIHCGAGGTESCDWADMLLRMYTRWCERSGYKLEMVDYAAGRRSRRAQRDASRSPATTPTASSTASAACTAWCASARSIPRRNATRASPAWTSRRTSRTTATSS